MTDTMDIYDDIRPLTRDDYDRATQRYVDELVLFSGVLAVYRFGGISAPGVSDLDLLVVVRDDIPPSALRRALAATKDDATAAYLFAHPPVVVPHSCVSDLPYVHTLYDLTPIWGDRVEFVTPAAREAAALQIAEYVDFTFNLRTVLRSMHVGRQGLRGILLLLTSAAHSLRIASSITGLGLHETLSDRVARLRERSVRGDHGVLDEARAAADACITALTEADSRLEHHLQAQGIISSAPLRTCISHTDGLFYLFETPFRPAGRHGARRIIHSAMWERLLRVDPGTEHFPGLYLAQFSAYGRGGGMYATLHRTFFGERPAGRILDPTYLDVLTMRVEIAERIHAVVAPGGLIPMIPLGIGFRHPDRIKVSRRRRLLTALAGRQAAGQRA